MFRFIDAEKGNFDVAVMCRVLGVSRSGYYAWARRPPSERTLANATLVEEIRRVHAESDGTYGSRRVHAELRREGREVNHKRIERLMRVEGIQGAYVPPKRRGNADCALGVDGVKVWPDLVKRDFQPTGPNQLWCSDLKQIGTGEGVLHLASVLDCFSRRIVGWAMGPVADAPLVARALEMAVSQRRPGEGIIHHADRGCQGGFKRSSQRSIERSCVGHTKKAEVGSGWPAADAFARPSAGLAQGASTAVLGGDRPRRDERGRWRGGWCLAGGWCPMVQGGWRDAVGHPGAAVGTLPVVRRAGGDRSAVGQRVRRAGDRAAARPLAVDDLSRAAS